jgi:hypothetical protein
VKAAPGRSPQSAAKGSIKAGARKPRPTRGLREAAVEATPQRLPPQRLLLCGPSLTSSPGQVPPPGMVTERLALRTTGVSHLAQRGVICFARIATTLLHERLPWVTTLCCTRQQAREGSACSRYALLGTGSAGGGRHPSDRLRAVPIGPPLALAASRGPGLTHPTLPRSVNGERGAG